MVLVNQDEEYLPYKNVWFSQIKKGNKCGATMRKSLVSMRMAHCFFRYALVVCIMLLCSTYASADALVRSQAMFADTIAEYYVEDDHVRLELEIGVDDVGSFRNLLPDDLYQQLDYGATPLQERLSKFINDDMPVLADDSHLVGRITSIGPATRPLRDAITGEVLPTPEDQAILVIRAAREH